MGKTGDAVQAVIAITIVTASMPDPLADCRAVGVPACPVLSPEQIHVHGDHSAPKVKAKVIRAVPPGPGTVTLNLVTSASVQQA
jgi:hypothetical protein